MNLSSSWPCSVLIGPLFLCFQKVVAHSANSVKHIKLKTSLCWENTMINLFPKSWVVRCGGCGEKAPVRNLVEFLTPVRNCAKFLPIWGRARNFFLTFDFSELIRRYKLQIIYNFWLFKTHKERPYSHKFCISCTSLAKAKLNLMENSRKIK